MKSSIRSFALATLVAIAPMTMAFAQNDASRINVPFSFNYGTAHFSAGTYTVSLMDQSVVAVTDSAHTLWAIVQSRSQENPERAGYLEFRKYGDQYFLAGYHPQGGATISLGVSKRERSLARDYAANRTDPGTVRLALLDTPVLTAGRAK